MYSNFWKQRNFNMKPSRLLFIALLFIAGIAHAQELRTFSNAEGQTFEDTLVKYDYEARLVTLDKRGNVPIDTFSKAEQDYILKWNMAVGFKSPIRFKTEITRGNWGRMKAEKTITPFWMDAIQVPGKQTPTHTVVMVDDYEEYTALYLEAEGYTITLKNQNFFPIENIVVESKIYFEQENFIIPDDFFTSMKNEYTDTATTNKVKYTSETIPVIIPREEVALYSACSIIVDQQVNRDSLTTETEVEDDAEVETVVEGFGDWDDHGRRRTGKLTGIWVRIGIKGPDGEMIWRELTDPKSLPKKVLWDSPSPGPTAAEQPSM